MGRLHILALADRDAELPCYAYPHPAAERAVEFSSKHYKHPDFPLSWGTIISPPMEVRLPRGTNTWTDCHTRAFRYLRIDASVDIHVLAIKLEQSAWPGKTEGEFSCSDKDVTRAWEMGCQTVQLCTQPALHSQHPIGEVGQWVIWDGCRRDREIWVGDLRPAALAHYALSSDHTPIRNSLKLAADAVLEDGLIPGSVSSRQVFYEYALWWIVTLWEYVLHSGEVNFAKELMPVLERLMEWVEGHVRKGGGLFNVTNSWSYTLPRTGPLCGPNAALCAAYRAAADLHDACGASGAKYRILAESHKQRILEKFYDSKNHIFRDTPDNPSDTRTWEDNNAHAILMDIAPPEDRLAILSGLKARLWSPNGSATCAPIFPEQELGNICPWAHNGTIWPFANAYEVGAWMKCGKVAEGLELLKRFTSACATAGTETIWEMIYPDGTIPESPDGRYLLSLCHAWGATGNHYLHRHVLGVRPAAPGWTEVILEPNLGNLDWATGTVPTPLGPIRVELCRSGKTSSYKRLEIPRGMRIKQVPENDCIEFIKN
ncbi:MAG: amylo-alpha-1,6-glucosidase [Verrucomicrobiota bacterium]